MRICLIALPLLLSSAAYAADQPAAAAGDAPPKDAKADAPKPDPDVAAASVAETAQPQKRSIAIRGRSLAYTVTPGTLTIRNDDGAPNASMFYVAYTVEPRGKPRPLTFLFNGGPGSSTMWLHMGSFGPIKVDASTPEMIAGPPFRYGANPDTLLDVTDLVFIDAPTTGLSRPVGKAEPKDFFGVDKDIDAFSRTIQRYLTKYGRWNSPKFMIGESYGTTRAGGLSKALADKGVQLNGIVLVSTVLNFADFAGDQSLINFLPDARRQRLVPRQDRSQARADELHRRGAGLRQRALCVGAAEGRHDQPRGKAVDRAANGALPRHLARLYPALEPARAGRPLPARVAARPP